MASDLKFEIFASRFFGAFWNEVGFLSTVPEILSLYPKEYNFDPKNADIYVESYYAAIFVRYFFYHCVFDDELRKFPTPFEPSPSYISDYISSTCESDFLFSDLTIFELLFTSIGFVIHLCFYCIRKLGYNDVLRYAHLSWAMYFDEYKEEFYSQGGWSQLKIVSLSYVLPHYSMTFYPKEIFRSNDKKLDFTLHVMKTVDNYKTFASRIHTNCKTVSKAWVKYLLNINKSEHSIVIKDTAKSQDIGDPKAIESFLLHFRRFCDPNTSRDLNVRAQPKFIQSCKKYTEETPRSLNHKKASQQSDTEVKQREFGISLQENDDQIDKLITTDLTRQKGKTSNTGKNDESRKKSFLKQKMTSRINFPRIKTQGTKDQKLNEETQKEVDLKRENPEVDCLLRTILVLGDPEGIAHVRSTLPSVGIRRRKK
ncbi:uncharacterized protein TNCT_683581 [Trichonephila clavata]|uniref:Uncharacterized protein n=1 Tax=Trichonephila clavata TaxID=2740835 RepID=A0A8X6I4E2_TRICU|nr:uncharacterized protein TNCT_683581 [Trichonephila clavata]